MTRQNYTILGGDLVVGKLLAQVHYWSLPGKDGKTKLRVVRDGKLWIAKTREQWCEETWLTLEQYKRAITVLKQKGLVETRIMKFGGQPMTHVRLCEGRFTEAVSGVKGTSQVEAQSPSKWSVSHHSSGVSDSTPCTALQSELRTSLAFVQGAVSDHAKSPDGSGENVNSDEIMQKNPVFQKTDAKTYGDSTTKTTLAMHWTSRTAHSKKKWQYKLTPKRSGQLKLFEKAVQEALPGKEDPHKLLDYAFDNWWSFSKRVAQDVGLSAVPGDPDIGFMLQYVGIMIDSYLQLIALPAKSDAKPAPHVPYDPPPSGAIGSCSGGVATLEELLAIEAAAEAEFKAKQGAGVQA